MLMNEGKTDICLNWAGALTSAMSVALGHANTFLRCPGITCAIWNYHDAL